ncbi:hypothetical protein ACJX0J_010716, partial [Zea mays]
NTTVRATVVSTLNKYWVRTFNSTLLYQLTIIKCKLLLVLSSMGAGRLLAGQRVRHAQLGVLRVPLIMVPDSKARWWHKWRCGCLHAATGAPVARRAGLGSQAGVSEVDVRRAFRRGVGGVDSLDGRRSAASHLALTAPPPPPLAGERTERARIVSWSFLLKVLEKVGFEKVWRDIISGILTTSSTQVLLNGPRLRASACRRAPGRPPSCAARPALPAPPAPPLLSHCGRTTKYKDLLLGVLADRGGAAAEGEGDVAGVAGGGGVDRLPCSGSASDPPGHAVLRPTLSFGGVRYPLLFGPAASNSSPEVASDSVHKVFYAVVEAAAVRADNSHLGGLARYPVSATLPQIGSRLFLTWGVFWSFPECFFDCRRRGRCSSRRQQPSWRYLIPILYVSVELVKALQAHIINWDIHMFDEEIGNTTQGGKFDHADRLFQSIENAYINSLSNTSDVKELIPEFFYMPEFLENSNSYHLGVKQDGEPIGDVALPPWAKDDNSSDEFDKDSIESDDRSLEELSWETLELLVVPHIF